MSDAIAAHILEDIPFHLDFPTLLRRAHVKAGSANAAELSSLAEAGAALARPKALYLVAYITERADSEVVIEGYSFHSRVLYVNMENAFRVFPYLATCGSELQAWGEGIKDMLQGYWVEVIKEMALGSAMQALNEHLEQHYRPGETSSMNPGSLADWPIEQQRVLFDLFGPHKDRIGVRLTDSMLMVPSKTVSGLRFPTSGHFESCQLCPRDQCPGRRAEYDPSLYQSKFDLGGV